MDFSTILTFQSFQDSVETEIWSSDSSSQDKRLSADEEMKMGEEDTKIEDGEEEKQDEEATASTPNGPVVYNGFYYAKYHQRKAKLYEHTDGTVFQDGSHKPEFNRDLQGSTSSAAAESTGRLQPTILGAIDEIARQQPT
ncbi:hypothetical protein F441_22276 [Phytophthora nicotianae CJ01A1]|uniref:Uncharacterized protein n=5 Tax=Phytophthora nicotianae TaxID=4792 RepID=V9DSL8_PHYNI|nr:hypothetical protein F443_23223 [Phytophthora nicotianae P1569]ETL46901.1 hypothetical protein L916_03298 [Phytophthora nicotianae]ETO63480.1 hypothetical protein F444_18823 [Phytophthora nicotianae P1976]ETP00308.1 hypothetical protein F441_22276 [Phytophthora nicotianae CJ01A1]ETP28188.1 hypothetical protein F442_22526 [Phytophthora nicotianae P10297]